MTDRQMTAREMAIRIKEMCQLYQEKINANPRFWRRAFALANNGIGINEATVRRLLYNKDQPRIRPRTREQLARISQVLEGMLSVPIAAATTDEESLFHRTDRQLIHGVRIKELKLIPDSRGYLMEYLRRDDEEFINDELPFGQVYVTTCNPGVVKAWHSHRLQHDRFGCIHGMAKLVLFDDREGSPTKGLVNEFVLGDLKPLLVVIPPDVKHGFACVGNSTAVMINIPTEVYNYQEPDEQRIDPHDNHIPYDWKRIDR